MRVSALFQGSPVLSITLLCNTIITIIIIFLAQGISDTEGEEKIVKKL